MTKIYTFVNQKGGVGKTTSTINLGAYLAYYGQRVLLVDIDPQANATSCLGIDKNQVKYGIYEVMIGNRIPSKAILHNPRVKLSLLPSSPSLAGAEVELINLEKRELRLREALEQIGDLYDYILVDCPPSLSLLTINGLMAAKDGIIIPVQCEYLALEGLGQLMQTVERIRLSLYKELAIRGVLLTMFDSRTNLSGDVVSEIQKYFGNSVFENIIPRSVRLAEAPSYGIPISIHAPNSTGAAAYHALANEVLQQDGKEVRIPASN
ncbi:MAG: ParA family protein [Anaerolineaceae bacterium]|nr:ParA family protein [Anaerolineaceae bacterium]